jgi:hypothetical protein
MMNTTSEGSWNETPVRVLVPTPRDASPEAFAQRVELMRRRVAESDQCVSVEILGYEGSFEHASLRCLYRLVPSTHVS